MHYTVSPVSAGAATLTAATGDKSASVPVTVVDDNLWPDIPVGEKNGMTLELLEDGSYHLHGSSQVWNSWQSTLKNAEPGRYTLSKTSTGNGVSVSVLNYDGTKTLASGNGQFTLDEPQNILCRVYNNVLGDIDGTINPKLVKED